MEASSFEIRASAPIPTMDASAPADESIPKTRPVLSFVLSDIDSALCAGIQTCMPRLAITATTSSAV